jgi:hypothetical protein
MILAARNGNLIATSLIRETDEYSVLQIRDNKRILEVSKTDDHRRAFNDMAGALEWAGDPKLAAEFR